MPYNPDSPSETTSPADAELMRRVCGRDDHAFEILVRRHEDKIFRLAQRRVGSREDARDIIQDVFIGLWRNPRAWRNKEKFTTWLYRIVYNRCLNHIRNRKIRSFLSLSRMTGDSSVLPPASDSPASDMEKREDSLRFQQALDRLPAAQKAAIHLRYIENMSVVEMAKSMGVSYRSAESRLYMAKKNLARTLEDKGDR